MVDYRKFIWTDDGSEYAIEEYPLRHFELVENNEKIKTATYKNFIFLEKIDLIGSEINVKFENIFFISPALFSNSKIINCLFHECEFEEEAVFLNVTFDQKMDFSNCTFHKEVNFSFSNLKSEANFSKNTCKKKAKFYNTVFNDKANFISSSFEGETAFYFSIFKDEAKFKNTTFTEKACFNDSTINKFKCRGVNTVKRAKKEDQTDQGIFNFKGARIDHFDYTDTPFKHLANHESALFLKQSALKKP